MKELMVTLLVIVSTGMVFGQQDNSSRFSNRDGASSVMSRGADFDSNRRSGTPPLVPIARDGDSSSASSFSSGSPSSSFRSTRPFEESGSSSNSNSNSSFRSGDLNAASEAGRRFDDASIAERRFNGFPASTERPQSSDSFTTNNFSPNRSNFSNGSATSTVEEKPFRLAIQGPDLAALLRDGQIKATPRDRRTGELLPIKSIIFSDRNEAQANKLTTAIDPVGFRDGEVVFSLTDDQIRGLENKTLYFDIPETYRGQIKEITVEQASYRPQGNTGFTRQNPVRNRDDFRDDSLDARPFGSDRLAQQDAIEPRNRRRDGWNLPTRNDGNQLAPRSMAETASEREARLAWERNNAETMRQRQLADEKRKLEASWQQLELEKLRQSQERDRQYAIQQRAERELQAQQSLPPSRWADSRNLYGQPNGVTPMSQPVAPQSWVPPGQSTNVDSAAVEVIAQQAKDIREVNDRLARAQNENQNLLRQRDEQNRFIQAKVNEEAEARLRDRFDPGSDSQPYFANSGVRREVAPPGTSSRPQLNVSGNGSRAGTRPADRSGNLFGAGVDDPNEKVSDPSNSKTEVMMLILLLLSVALNLYLWWLAQSFYSRYQDLADELRETFTATV